MKKGENIVLYVIDILLAFLIILILFKRLFVSCDIDEIHSFVEAWRFTKGDTWFKKDWNIYMTSSLVEAFFLKIKQIVDGDMNGGIIYIRIVSTVIQLLIAIFSIYVLKEKIKIVKKNSYLLSALIILYTFKKNLAPDYANLQLWIPTIIFLLAICYSDTCKNTYLVFMGILSSILILAYPTYILLFFLYLIGIVKVNETKIIKKCSLYMATCLFCLVIFLSYVLYNMKFSSFLQSISNSLDLCSHTSNISDKFFVYCGQIFRELVIVIVILCFSKLIVCLLLRKMKSTEQSEKELWVLIAILLNFIVEIFECIYTNSDWHLRYIMIITILGLKLVKLSSSKFLWFGYLPGVCTYVSTYIGTDIPKFVNTYKALFLSMFTILILFMKDDTQRTVNSSNKNMILYLKKCVLICTFLFMIFQNMFYVRVTSRVENVFDFCGIKMESGILKGIYLNEKEAVYFNKLETALKNTNTDYNKLLYLGMNVGVYSTNLQEYTVCAPSIVWSDYRNGVVFEKYYEINKDRIPEIVIYEKKYPVIRDECLAVYVDEKITKKIMSEYVCVYSDDEVDIYEK